MKNKFAITSNVETLLAAMSRTEERGAREAGWVVVEGKAGFGKTETVQWFAIKNAHIYLRANPGWTQRWFLRDLLVELEHSPKGQFADGLFEQASQALRERPRTVIIDEANHCIHSQAVVLETIRALSDVEKFPVVIVGHEGLGSVMKRFPHIHSRVAEFVKFTEANEADVEKLLEARAEVDVPKELVAVILEQSGGRPRLVLNAIAKLESIAKQNGGKIEVAAVIREQLVQPRGRKAA